MTTDPLAAYYEVEEGLARVHLNRPDRINAFDLAMRDALWEILRALHQDPAVEAVLLLGNGDRGFCAGADLTEFGTAPSRVIAREARYLRDVWSLLLSLPIPTVAALHGYVLGSGVEMALCCDLRVASENTVFGLPEVALGMIPFAGGSQTLPRTVGRSHALDLLLTGRRIDAMEALRIGLVHHLVPRDRLRDAAYDLLRELRRAPPLALRRAKEALQRGRGLSLAAGLAVESSLAAASLYDGSRSS